MRVLAIAAVVLSHLVAIAGPRRFYGAAIDLGAWGVDVFFVLSGYLLSRAFIEAALKLRPRPSVRLFLLRRALRIWPLYAAAVIFSATLQSLHGRHSVSGIDVLAHLFFVHGFFPEFVISKWNGPLWTMAVDAQFYIALPLVFSMFYRLTSRLDRRSVGRLIVATGALTIAGSILWRGLIHAWLVAHVERYSEMYVSSYYAYAQNLLGLASVFTIGSLLAYADVVKPVSSSPKKGDRGLAVIAVIVTGAMLYSCATIAHEDVRFLTQDLVGALFVAALLFCAVHLRWSPGETIASSSQMRVAAALAYAFYLFHEPITFAWFSTLTNRLHDNVLFVTLSVSVLLTTGVVGYVGHRFIERPALDAKERAREIVVVS